MNEEKVIVNNVMVINKGLFSITVLYVDTKDHYADQIFINSKIPVKFLGDYGKDEEKYELVLCKVKNKYADKFGECLKTLEKKILLADYNDYIDYCKSTFEQIKNAHKKLKK